MWFMGLVYVLLVRVIFLHVKPRAAGVRELALRDQNVDCAAVPSCSCDTVCIDTQEKARFHYFRFDLVFLNTLL